MCVGEVWRTWLCLPVELCGAQDGGQRDSQGRCHRHDHHQPTEMADICLIQALKQLLYIVNWHFDMLNKAMYSKNKLDND